MSSPPASGANQGASTSKRRRTSDPGWASLPGDLVRLLASRLLAGDLLDYVRFRAVCPRWRAGTDSPCGRGVTDSHFHPRRWMMLPEGHGLYPGHPDLGGYARFLNLDTGVLVRAHIPLLGDHCVAIDSVDGLLLLLRDSYDESAVRLLHPFTGDITELPPLGSPLPQLGTQLHLCPAHYRVRRLSIITCASASFDATGVITVMLALHLIQRVAFATSLEERWTLSTWEYPISRPPFSYRGKLYILHTPSPTSSSATNTHRILRIDPPVQDGAGSSCFALHPPKSIATISASELRMPMCLVECDSDILLLGYNDLSMLQILVWKLADLVQQRFIPIKSIGDNTLVVGERSMSVSSRVLPTVKGGGNIVYIRSRQPYLAQYHLSRDTVSPAIDDCSLYGCAQGPSSLVHYIFSCCTRVQWNRGLLFRMNPQDGFGTR